jgi:hypothetical protein
MPWGAKKRKIQKKEQNEKSENGKKGGRRNITVRP